jgi:hypothetical protein
MSENNTYNEIMNYIGIIKNYIVEITKNINKYNPLNNMFIICIEIFYKVKSDDLHKIFVYFLKIFIPLVIIVMPFILAIYSCILLSNITGKNKEYWWSTSRFNYDNTQYLYIKQLFNIFGIIISRNILIYLGLCLIFLITFLIMKVKFPYLIDEVGHNFKQILYFNLYVFTLIFFIFVTYLSINYNKYKRIYEHNKEINNVYIKYLNKDYAKIICNNFIDDDNMISNICNIEKLPTSTDLNEYLNKLEIENIRVGDVDLDNEYNDSIGNNTAKKFLSALITHQWLIFIYENSKNKLTNDNKSCREFKLSTITNDSMYNIFYCYHEKLQFPFSSDVENDIIKGQSKEYFKSNYEVYTKIIDKYIELNNNIADNISKIKKEKVDEITIIILIAIIFILYLIGLLFLFNKDGKSSKESSENDEE